MNNVFKESRISVREMWGSSHEDSLSRHIVIPYYQRGYRWTTIEVLQLLEDVVQWNETSPYFLQLLVYRVDAEGRWRIIDGQQRLTTVMLILETFKAFRESSSLGTEVGEEAIFGRLDSVITYDRKNQQNGLDAHFKADATTAVLDWCRKNNQEIDNVESKILQSEFLRYEVRDLDAEVGMFRRINKWKVSATDSEIVKCKLLTGDTGTRSLEWNVIERALSDDSFWSWMAPTGNRYDGDRMGLLLRYAGFGSEKTSKGKEKVQKFPLYESCLLKLKSNDVEGVWKSVLFAFERLQRLYLNDRHYHMHGWLVHIGTGIEELRSRDIELLFREKAKSVFDMETSSGVLLRDDEKLYKTESDNWRKDRIVNLLFLANIAWCLSRGLKYDFAAHRKVCGKWSVEHIHAKNQAMLDEHSFKSLAFRNECNGDVHQLWVAYSQRENEEAEKFLAERLSGSANYPDADEDHSLGNLALLPRNTNSSLNDKSFPYKLAQILDWCVKRSTDYWVPPMTLAVFSKEISTDSWPYWSTKDRDGYKKCLVDLIDGLLKSNAEQEN